MHGSSQETWFWFSGEHLPCVIFIMFYTYVLYSLKDNQFYTGYIADMEKRLLSHNNGEVFSTKNRRPLRLIYFEACHNQVDALYREKYLKTTYGKSLEEKNLFLSFITQLELLGNRNIKPNYILKIKQFISECTIIDITPGIKEFTISIRQKYSIKLPDSIIMVTSLWLNMPLINADHDFKKIDVANLIHFKR